MKKNLQKLHLVTQVLSLVSIGISSLLLHLVVMNNNVLLSDLANDIYNIEIATTQITIIRIVLWLPNVIQVINIILSLYLYANDQNKKIRYMCFVWIVTSILYTVLNVIFATGFMSVVVRLLMAVTWVSKAWFVYLIYINYFKRREI